MKYVVYPDYVTSKRDGDDHFIGAPQLMRLYGVDPRDCLVIGLHETALNKQQKTRRAEELKLIPLYPRYDGNYTLPKGA